MELAHPAILFVKFARVSEVNMYDLSDLDLNQEIWKTLIYQGKEFPDFEVSNFGQLRNIKTGTLYRQHINPYGYCQVCVSLGSRNKKKVFKLHKAVAETFIPNPENKPEVNHKNGDKNKNVIKLKCGELELSEERKLRKYVVDCWLYEEYKKLTGRTLSWGLLTGVRPTKIAMQKVEEGMDKDSFVTWFGEDSLVSEKKAELAYDIAQREKEVLSPLDYKDGYSLYVGIPFCPTVCTYCSFSSGSLAQWKDYVDAYLDALCKELEFIGEASKNKKLNTIYIGGGTPTWLNEDKMAEILDAVYTYFNVSAEAEVSMECNPGTVTSEKLEKYRRAGVNRLSIGLQSTDDEELTMLGRIHTFEQFLKTYEMARNAGFHNINIDLISGIPYQTEEKFLHTLQKVIRLRPEHISSYSLIVEEGTPFYDAYRYDVEKQEAGMQTDILPTEDEVYRIYKMTQHYLAKAGYKQYEISNFAKPGYESKHNMNCWKQKEYIGVGLTAASYLDGVRYSNIGDLNRYIENVEAGRLENNKVVEEIQQEIDRQREFMLLGLRMLDGVSIQEFKNKFAQNPLFLFKKELDKLVNANLLVVDGDRIKLTSKGIDLANQVWMEFV